MIDNTVILNAFQSAAAPIAQAANWIFWTIAGISLVINITKALRQPEIISIFGEVAKFVFVIGFYSWLLTNATEYAKDIIISLSQLGQQSGSTDLGKLSVGLFSAITSGIGILATVANPATAIGLIIIGVGAALAGFSIVIYQWLIIIQGYILAYVGPIVLAASSFEGTHFAAHNYFKAAVATGLKLLTINVMCAASGKIIIGLISYINSSNNGTGVKMMTAVGCLGMVMGIAALSLFTPGFIASLVYGHSSATAALGAIAGMGVGISSGINEIAKNTNLKPKPKNPGDNISSKQLDVSKQLEKNRSISDSIFPKKDS